MGWLLLSSLSVPRQPTIWICLVSLTVWSVVLGLRLQKWLLPQLIAMARRSGRPALVGFVFQAGSFVGFLLLWLIGSVIGSIGGDARWAGVTVVPAALAYGPTTVLALPSDISGFHWIRQDLQEAGAAGRKEARSIAWGGGWVALVGWLATIAALDATFALFT